MKNKAKVNIGFLIMSCLLLASCGSSPTKQAAPLGFKAGAAQFQLLPTKVTLHHGLGAPEDSTLFASEDDVQATLHKDIEASMQELNLLESSSELSVEFVVSYTRIYNHGGKSLNKPRISYVTNLFKNGASIGSFSSGEFTTKYAYLKEIAVNAEIAAFKWGAEDEPRDLAIVASVIAKDLSRVGD